ncbi:MAG: JAB domain-containing protein [Clostridia bacterium]
MINLKKFYCDDYFIYESVFLILLDDAERLIGYCQLAQGSLNCASVDIRLIAKYAIESLATKVILIHNHPKCDVFPSKEDIKYTIDCKDALNTLNINLIDHIIISDNKYFSFFNSEIIRY